MTTADLKPLRPLEHSPASNFGKWMALTAALLGWLFDGFEIGMFPLVGRPALAELLGNQPKAYVDQWFGVITAVFLIGAASGGVIFGWLGDRIGRVRAMSLSIFTYAIFTGLCGFATDAWHIAVLRFVASLGMGGEWSLGVALVNEIWPQRSRAMIAGLIGAASNVGIGLVPILSLTLLTRTDSVHSGMTAIGLSEKVVEPLLRNQAWRLLMIAGALPALLIFFIRLFVPESGKWEEQKQKGATSHWATFDLLGVLAGTVGAGMVITVWSPLVQSGVVRAFVTVVGLAMALFGFLYPVLQYLRRASAAAALTDDAEAHRADGAPLEFADAATVRRLDNRRILGRLLLGAGLSGVALLGTWGSLQWAAGWAIELTKSTPTVLHAKEFTQISLSIGAIVGTVLAALVADKLGRRMTYTLLCVGSTLSLLAFYQFNQSYGPRFLATVFLAGGTTAAFYGWFPLYLPELFRTSIRATSQGFAYNFGRVIAAVGTLQTATVMGFFGGSLPKAGSVLSAIYLIGVSIVWLGPETKGKPLPE
jgi:SHS family sialic acid transporter-like MFS transporter